MSDNVSKFDPHPGKSIARRIVLFVLALVSAFGWPGWAVRTPAKPVAVPTATPSKATVKAKALPGDATALLRAMPDHVSNFARVQADSTDAWADSNPIEEYKLTYSNGNDKDAVQLTVADLYAQPVQRRKPAVYARQFLDFQHVSSPSPQRPARAYPARRPGRPAGIRAGTRCPAHPYSAPGFPRSASWAALGC